MPSIQIPNYLDAIVESFPTVVVRSDGSPSDFANLVHEGGDAMPTKAQLDTAVLNLTRARMWQAIQDERTRRQNGGVFIASVNKWFHSDQTSRIQQLGLVMMGASLPTGIMWKTMDGSFIEMTQGIASSIFNGAATLDLMSFSVAEQHRAGMMAAADPAAYNFSGFWPAIYGG